MLMQQSVGALAGYPNQASQDKASYAAIPPPQPQTMVAAISSLSELNSRLAKLSASVSQVAQAIGGPYPAGAPKSVDRPAASSVLGALNDHIDGSHAWASDLENSIDAIRRMLGGPDNRV